MESTLRPTLTTESPILKTTNEPTKCIESRRTDEQKYHDLNSKRINGQSEVETENFSDKILNKCQFDIKFKLGSSVEYLIRNNSQFGEPLKSKHI